LHGTSYVNAASFKQLRELDGIALLVVRVSVARLETSISDWPSSNTLMLDLNVSVMRHWSVACETVGTVCFCKTAVSVGCDAEVIAQVGISAEHKVRHAQVLSIFLSFLLRLFGLGKVVCLKVILRD